MSEILTESEAQLLVQERTDHVSYSLRMDRETSSLADPKLKPGDDLPAGLLFDIHFALGEVVIYPLSTLPLSNFLKQKYQRVRSISFEYDALGDPPLTSQDAKSWLFDYMPGGFIKDCVFGLGVLREMRPWLDAVEEIPGVKHIQIAAGEATRLEAETYIVNAQEYENLRLAFQRISKHYQTESLADRGILAHNKVLHGLDPAKYPEKERPYKPGTVYKMLGGRAARQTRLSRRDRKGIIGLTKANIKDIAAAEPSIMIDLQRDIEIVNLDEVIRQFRRGLEKPRVERAWQRLFEANPFILSMAFGYPIVEIQSSATVGGVTYAGAGAKIADFLKANPTTLNAAIVEIKKPQSKLLGGIYREGVRKPHPELIASVTQLLDQRYALMTNIATWSFNSKRQDLRPYSVDCVLIMGTMPDEKDIASFELIRNQFRDVRVITYDELLNKLVALRSFLANGADTPTEIEDSEPNNFWDGDDDEEDLGI